MCVGLTRVDWMSRHDGRIMGLGANRTLAVVETDWSITHWQVGRRGLDESQLRAPDDQRAGIRTNMQSAACMR